MQIATHHAIVSVPMPVFLIIEDVGWWQGADGSAANQPFRTGIGRRHCLADYQALARLARQLRMRIALGMVMGEWDRTNYLREIEGATWMGGLWDNRVNQGPWLDEAGDYLRENGDWLEIALHGLCHEFWQNGRMERSEFHDSDGHMRPRDIVRRHIEAFGVLLRQNRFPDFPRFFIPPALHHSFGNGDRSIQALLKEYGIHYVVTRFSRARRFSPPVHDKITWESGVGLLARGISPARWHEAAPTPRWDFANPILPLHWGNVLHPDPARNPEIVDGWAKLLLTATNRLGCILSKDIASCWNQAAVFYLGRIHADREKVTIDLPPHPDLPSFDGSFFIKIKDSRVRVFRCKGAQIISHKHASADIQTLHLLPEKGRKIVELFFSGMEQALLQD